MSTLLVTHPAALNHVTPPGHPERVERLEAILEALKDARFAALHRDEAPLADETELLRCHDAIYVAEIKAARPRNGGLTQIDPDTFMSEGSWEAALRAVGGVEAAVDAVLSGKARNAFVAMRPPGHHAETARSMGFCLFGTVAIAAKYALDSHGLSRVAVLDFDVHHGNGTEAIFWHDEDAFYASSHEWPQYPGTGRASDRGAYDNIANAPLPTGADGEEFRRAWGERLLPALSDFGPHFLVISAGFDAHRADPLGGLALTEDDFDWVTRELLGVAGACCGGRVVSVLEGGYELGALARSASAHVAALMKA